MERKLLDQLDMEVSAPTTETLRVFKKYVRDRYRDTPRPWEKIELPPQTHVLSVASGGYQTSAYPYPVPSRRPTEPYPQPSSQSSSIRPSASSDPSLRLDTTFQTSSSAGSRSNQARSYRDSPHAAYSSQPLCDSPDSSPFPITPDDYEVPETNYYKKALEAHVAKDVPSRDRVYVELPTDACFGSVAPRGNRSRAAAA